MKTGANTGDRTVLLQWSDLLPYTVGTCNFIISEFPNYSGPSVIRHPLIVRTILGHTKQSIPRWNYYYSKGKGKVFPLQGPVWPRGWVEV